MTKEEFIKKIKNAGVVGAGGAGFPTHIKLNNEAEFFIVNIAECEPLLKVDQQLAQFFATELVKTIDLIHNLLNIKKSYIAIKEKYEKAISNIQPLIKNKDYIKIHILENVYPAGDEQDIIYNVTGRIVPEGGLPLDVGVIVDNIGTLLNIYNSLSNIPVTHRWVTITGEVKNPQTLLLPIGTLIEDAINLCGGSKIKDFVIIDGGPMMGKIVSPSDTVKKTTSGIIIFPDEHYFIQRKLEDIKNSIEKSRSVCEQCSLCTEYCSRHLLGHKDLQPHLMMRKISYLNVYDLSEYVDAYLCSGCGVCSYYACPMLLSPKDIYAFLKQALGKNNIKNPYQTNKVSISETHPMYEERRVPVEKLKLKIDVKKYDKDAPIKLNYIPNIKKVQIALQQHIGIKAIPKVRLEQKVKTGELIADIPANKVGARIHSSINGKVNKITDNYIEIIQ